MDIVMVQPTLLETSMMRAGVGVLTVVGVVAVGVGGALLFWGLLKKVVLQQPGARSDWATDFVGGLGLVAAVPCRLVGQPAPRPCVHCSDIKTGQLTS